MVSVLEKNLGIFFTCPVCGKQERYPFAIERRLAKCLRCLRKEVNLLRQDALEKLMQQTTSPQEKNA